MDDIISLRVGLDARAYDIKIGSNLIAKAGSVLADIVAGRQAVIVSDSNVAPLHLRALVRPAALLRPARRWRWLQVDRLLGAALRSRRDGETSTASALPSPGRQ